MRTGKGSGGRRGDRSLVCLLVRLVPAPLLNVFLRRFHFFFRRFFTHFKDTPSRWRPTPSRIQPVALFPLSEFRPKSTKSSHLFYDYILGSYWPGVKAAPTRQRTGMNGRSNEWSGRRPVSLAGIPAPGPPPCRKLPAASISSWTGAWKWVRMCRPVVEAADGCATLPARDARRSR